MFYCFTVCEDPRDFLRFLWFEDNDLTKPVTEYQMTVHVFGNSPSPAVAIYSFRRAAQEGQKEHGKDAEQFIMRNFYVDDGLTSFPTAGKACTRAVNIEVIESRSTSSFINALRRFTAIRGPMRLLRSDRGTNFIGACKELQINTEDPELKVHLQDKGCTWSLNPPHSSHMGGVWERMVGVARRILDAMLLKENCRLTHGVLVTLMAEVMAMMNARPLVPVSSDPDMPAVFTPAMLLTQKIDTVSAPQGDMDLKDPSSC
jgi:hypothetical protein